MDKSPLAECLSFLFLKKGNDGTQLAEKGVNDGRIKGFMYVKS